MTSRLRDEGGFGLIELLIAMTVMSIGIFALVAGFSSRLHAQPREQDRDGRRGRRQADGDASGAARTQHSVIDDCDSGHLTAEYSIAMGHGV